MHYGVCEKIIGNEANHLATAGSWILQRSGRQQPMWPSLIFDRFPQNLHENEKTTTKKNKNRNKTRPLALGRPRGGARDVRPGYIFYFHAVFCGKLGQIIVDDPTFVVGASLLGNPGSATAWGASLVPPWISHCLHARSDCSGFDQLKK